MSIQVNPNAKPSEPTTQSRGNGHGRPIVPVLLGVLAVIAFIAIYRIGTGMNNVRDAMSPRSSANSTYQVPYDVRSTSTTAMGQERRGMNDIRSAPAGGSSSGTSMAGSSSMPMEPTSTPVAGASWVAPVEPKASQSPSASIQGTDNTSQTSQGMNR